MLPEQHLGVAKREKKKCGGVSLHGNRVLHTEFLIQTAKMIVNIIKLYYTTKLCFSWPILQGFKKTEMKHLKSWTQKDTTVGNSPALQAADQSSILKQVNQ